ncbi:hypothetical protein ABMD26_000342 [Pseudomonas sp. PvP001]
MATALGAHLVFDVHGRGAELDHRLDGAGDIKGRRAETGVDVDQQRQIAHIGDAAHVGQHIVQTGNAQIGKAQGAGRNAATGQVDSLETGALGEQGVVGVDGADHLQGRLFGEGLTEALAGAGGLTHDGAPGVLFWLGSR